MNVLVHSDPYSARNHYKVGIVKRKRHSDDSEAKCTFFPRDVATQQKWGPRSSSAEAVLVGTRPK
jgi:hypothetical protein